jgi:hypothetical protein
MTETVKMIDTQWLHASKITASVQQLQSYFLQRTGFAGTLITISRLGCKDIPFHAQWPENFYCDGLA